MKRNRRPFLKHKLSLYFDENFPAAVLTHFRKRKRWKKKIKVLSALELGNAGKSDEAQLAYCSRNEYTLVTLDDDFNDDNAFPFGNGTMHGVIIVKDGKGDAQHIIRVLGNVLDFLHQTPLPKRLTTETKFVVSGEGCVMRGRDAKTKEVKSLHVAAGETKLGDVWSRFSL